MTQELPEMLYQFERTDGTTPYDKETPNKLASSNDGLIGAPVGGAPMMPMDGGIS